MEWFSVCVCVCAQTCVWASPRLKKKHIIPPPANPFPSRYVADFVILSSSQKKKGKKIKQTSGGKKAKDKNSPPDYVPEQNDTRDFSNGANMVNSHYDHNVQGSCRSYCPRLVVMSTTPSMQHPAAHRMLSQITRHSCNLGTVHTKQCLSVITSKFLLWSGLAHFWTHRLRTFGRMNFWIYAFIPQCILIRPPHVSFSSNWLHNHTSPPPPKRSTFHIARFLRENRSHLNKYPQSLFQEALRSLSDLV